MNMPLVLLNRRRRGFTAFSPASIFSTTAIGIWLDPSDLSTMFSDRAGTTPVTTPGTVVGLRLDKSKGLALGAELVTNGTFDNGTTGWTAYLGATLSNVGGRLRIAASANFEGAYSSFPAVIGKRYRVEYSAYKGTSTSFRFEVSYGAGGGFNYDSGALSADRVNFVFSFVATHTTTFIGARCDNAGTYIELDNISVRELAGNHAVAPTDAARPIYGVEPKGGRRNLLDRTEDFGNAFWGKTSATIPVTQYSAPDGTTTADKVDEQATSGAHLVFNAAGFAAAPGQYTCSIYLKAAERGFGFIQIATNNGGKRYTVVIDLSTGGVTATSSSGTPTGIANSVVSAGSGWWRVSVTSDQATNLAYLLTGPVSTAVPTFDAFATPNYTGVSGSGILIWGAQLELGSTATNYQRVLSAYDITEAGVQSCHYVQYDGSDDSMSTSAIDFTATDKMSVFAGVSRLGTSGTGVFAELGAGGPPGSFNLYRLTATDFQFINSGTIEQVTASATAPPNSILAGLGDISGDTATLRINGAQVAQATANQGTGNYKSASIFFGRRNNATLPFNGKDYGIIVVGKTASATEISNTELWLSDKTAEVDVAKSISPNIYTRSGDTILDRANSIIERRTV